MFVRPRIEADNNGGEGDGEGGGGSHRPPDGATPEGEAGGSLPTTPRPKSNFLLFSPPRVCMCIHSFTLKVNHAPISVECLLRMT
jgi:hypothetical protein